MDGIAVDGLARGGVRIIERGQRLRPTRADGLVRVESGLVAVSTVLEDGRRQLLCLSTPGEIVCPICEPDIWIEALAPTRLCVVDCPDEALFALAHDRLKQANRQLVTLGRYDGVERVAAFLAEMAHRLGAVDAGGGAALHLPMSREDIADYLGLNAETVSRILTRLRKAGLVRFSTPVDCRIPDLAALESRVPRAPMSPPERLMEARP